MLSRFLVALTALARLARTETASIVDATKTFVKSSESTFDHEVVLKEGQLAFHWNDIVGNTVEGRLIHTAPADDDAPSWLGLGIYDTFENTNPVTPSTPLMVGSDAVIGLVETGKVLKYALDGKQVSEDDGVHLIEFQTLVSSEIVQHDGDDGSVTTVLSFEKLLEESDFEEVRIRHSGENVFLWAIGPPGASTLAKHSASGAFTLDLDKVQKEAELSGGGDGGTDDSNVEPTTADSNTSPIVLGSCESEFEETQYKVDLMPLLSFHYTVDTTAGTLKGILKYEGEAWLGHGFSVDGNMIGSTAIIGEPESESVKEYSLTDKAIGGVVASDSQTLVASSITQEDGVTILRFEKPLDEGNGDTPIAATGLNTFLFAVGSINQLGYHEHRGAYRIDLSSCEYKQSKAKSHMGAFAAHGTFAVLAWGMASPFAITVAWFRTLVPSSWIYIHVFSNVISFFFTLVAVIIAVSAMSVQKKASHFYDPHHWVGLLLLVAVTFQVMNGFLRPPVEKKDPYAASHYDMDNSWIKLPQTPREYWYFSHRATGISMLAMGIYQIQSGLDLFAQNFYVDSMAPYFWVYVGLFAFCLVSLKFWIMYEEYKARRGMEAMHVDHRSSAGSSAGGMSHTDSELVPVQFDMT